ncbi:DUF6177 family protein [Streptomyces sp. DH24]|uniref:DUF6177 family protein n=1 Tax=Streptomyces sp. DH24 TaxID=3040123 RepID=UPI0024424C65|nr:DUF6177 family protein [Streptomyces sp. DH24]MDG9718719.1 DUF6177 family protein [Streptomyces sp. DH24]
MTKDVIALTPRMPDLRTLLAGFYAGGPGVGVGAAAGGAVVQLCASDGRPLVSVEAPVLVQVPGETVRLLGEHGQEEPVWWTEARASTAVEEAGRLAGSFAGRLATVLGGTVWPPHAATTEVVPLTTDVAAVPVPPTAHPAVDVLTDGAVVVIQDRPLVPMTSWLSDALRLAADTGRALQIVTPPTARLTLPTRTALRGLPNRWVVKDPDCGYYDGLSGAVLHWQGGVFTPVRDAQGNGTLADAHGRTRPTRQRQLLLTLRTRHAPTPGLTLGDALETVFRHLTGEPPAGWSTAEPVNLPWSTRQLTDLARSRAPRPTWLVAVGRADRPALATLRVTRTPGGVEEDMSVAVGYGADEEPPLDAVEPLAAELGAEHALVNLLTTVRAARRDLTVPARCEASPHPVSLTVGHDEARRIGIDGASAGSSGAPSAVRLGRPTEAALHYRLGDGTQSDAWARLRALVAQWGPEGKSGVPTAP